MFETATAKPKTSKLTIKSQRIAVVPKSTLNQHIIDTLEQAAPYLDHIYIYDDWFDRDYNTDIVLSRYIGILEGNPKIKEKLSEKSDELGSDFLKKLALERKEIGDPVIFCLFEVDCNKLKDLMIENNELFQLRPLYIDPSRRADEYLQLIKREENLRQSGDLAPTAVGTQSNLMQVLEIQQHLFTNLINYLAIDLYETSTKAKDVDFKVPMITAYRRALGNYFSQQNKALDFDDCSMVLIERLIEGQKCSTFTLLFKELLKLEQAVLENIALLSEHRGFMLTATIICTHIDCFLSTLNNFLIRENNTESKFESDEQKSQELIKRSISQLELVKFCLERESNSPVDDLEDKRTIDYSSNLLRFPELCTNDSKEAVQLGYKLALIDLDNLVVRVHKSYKKANNQSAICFIWEHVSYRINEKKDILSSEAQFYIKGGALLQEYNIASERKDTNQEAIYKVILDQYHNTNPTIIAKFEAAYVEYQENERLYFIKALKNLFLTEIFSEAESKKSYGSEDEKEKEQEERQEQQPVVLTKFPLKLQKLVLAIQSKEIDQEKVKRKNKKEEKEKEAEMLGFNNQDTMNFFQECAFDFLAHPKLYNDCNSQFIELIYEYLYVTARDEIISIHHNLMLERNIVLKAGQDKDVKAPTIEEIFIELTDKVCSYKEKFKIIKAAVKNECRDKQKRHEEQPLHQALHVVSSLFKSDAPKAFTKSDQVGAYQRFLNKFCDFKFAERGIKEPDYFRIELEKLVKTSAKIPAALAELSEIASTTEYISFLNKFAEAISKDSARLNNFYKETSELAYEYAFNELGKELLVINDIRLEQTKVVSEEEKVQLNSLTNFFQRVLNDEKLTYQQKYEMFLGRLQSFQKNLQNEQVKKGGTVAFFSGGNGENIANTKAGVDKLINAAIIKGNYMSAYKDYKDSSSPKKGQGK